MTVMMAILAIKMASSPQENALIQDAVTKGASWTERALSGISSHVRDFDESTVFGC